jgi:flagellar biosynthetic protein FliP
VRRAGLFLSAVRDGRRLDADPVQGVGPYLSGTKTLEQAYTDGVEPAARVHAQAHPLEEIALMTRASGEPAPATAKDVELRTLVPAFGLSELRAAFIIGFVVFVPFLVVDIVVSACS